MFVLLQLKTEMLDNLLEIEIAYNLLKGGEDSAKDPIDVHYERLKTEIKVTFNLFFTICCSLILLNIGFFIAFYCNFNHDVYIVPNMINNLKYDLNMGIRMGNVGIKMGGRIVNNLRYADDTTLFSETENYLNPKSFQGKCWTASEFAKDKSIDNNDIGNLKMENETNGGFFIFGICFT